MRPRFARGGGPTCPRSHPDQPSTATAFALAALLTVSCGKMGPPLPPLVRVPVRPDNLTAERRGDTVDLRFVVPAANTDGSRPANVERVDVYGFTGPSTATDEDIQRFGTRIAGVEVNIPPDPDAVEETADPPPEPALQAGVDQGATAHVTEQLTADVMTPVDLPPPTDLTPRALIRLVEADVAPILARVPTRIYMAVGVGGRGRTGPAARRAVVPLVPAPPPPRRTSIAYDEQGITVSWTPPETAETVTYHLYDVRTPTPGGPLAESRLTKTAVSETQAVDSRIEWGAERCYVVRSVQTVAGLLIQSDAPLPTCVTLRDTFPPRPPSGLTAVATAGAISLIWDASSDADLGGYLVLRGSTREALTAVTPAPIQETTLRDVVPSGTRVLYAIRAVDKSGNASAPSEVVEETAR